MNLFFSLKRVPQNINNKKKQNKAKLTNPKNKNTQKQLLQYNTNKRKVTQKNPNKKRIIEKYLQHNYKTNKTNKTFIYFTCSFSNDELNQNTLMISGGFKGRV